MRMVSFIEAVLFLIAFGIVFLVLLTDRSTQRTPASKLVPAPKLAPAPIRCASRRVANGPG